MEEKYIKLKEAHKELRAALKKVIECRKEHDWRFEEYMLADLILSDNLFLNNELLLVNCNDVFAWGCADAEPISLLDIPDVYQASKTMYGIVKWVCKRRSLQPQKPYIKAIKNGNEWDESMEALPKNSE